MARKHTAIHDHIDKLSRQLGFADADTAAAVLTGGTPVADLDDAGLGLLTCELLNRLCSTDNQDPEGLPVAAH